MLKILRKRLVSIALDESGAALAITLAVFMLLWVMIAAVWAIGTSVRNRIHLQNACDAAAYSAAVVQADTLSRIATINRAMSWTYVQMTRRQMDYITYKWLDHAVDHFEDDAAEAKEWCESGTGCPSHTWSWIGVDVERNRHDDMALYVYDGQNSAKCYKTKIEEIENANDNFLIGHMPNNSTSFFAVDGKPNSEEKLRNQIEADKTAIKAMNAAEVDLMDKLPGRISKTVEEVLAANIPVEFKDAYTQQVFQQNPTEYMSMLDNGDERRFLAFSGYDDPEIEDDDKMLLNLFSAGINRWYDHKGNEGIQRGYNRASERLYATWQWQAVRSTCEYVTGVLYTGWVHKTTEYHESECEHSHSRDSCSGGKVHTAISYADNSTCYDDDRNGYYYDGESAQPFVLDKEYFGKDGTITVGLSVANTNMWALLGTAVSRGIYSAFNPFVTKTVCFASAKAGYKHLGSDENGRNYRIDWNANIQDWNLCQSDWDAVLVPVKRAGATAYYSNERKRSIWGAAADFLADYAAALGVENDVFEAGGTKEVKVTRVKDGYHWTEYLDYEDLEPDNSGHVQAKWLVENPGANVKWDNLQDRMWH